MKRTLKKILNKFPNLICITFLLIVIFIANGYGILKERLDISGKATIVEDREETIKPRVIFKKTQQMGDYIYFYDIILYNESNVNYHNWQIKIKDTEYISYPYSVDGKRTDDGWILCNYNWNDRIEAGEKVNVTITFEISREIPSEISIEQYVENFLNNSIEITCSNKEIQKQGITIKNGNATLTLKESEIEIKDYRVQLDKDYLVENPNEKMYTITINNNTESDYLIIRGNIYVGTNNKVLEVSPSAITCNHNTDATFTLPVWVQVPKGQSLIIYVMISTTDENLVPEVALAATI